MIHPAIASYRVYRLLLTIGSIAHTQCIQITILNGGSEVTCKYAYVIVIHVKMINHT